MQTLPFAAILAFTVCLTSGATAVAQPAQPARVVIDTAAGEIEIELDASRAPRSVANFLRYVDEQFFDGTSFYRTVTAGNQPDNLIKIAVIQGGADGARAAHDPIALERTSVTGLKHLDGTVSMARNGPDTATSEFFICVGDQPELDLGGRRNADGQGFAAFGRVVRGLEVVKLIHDGPVDRQRLAPPVAIRSMRRVANPPP